MHKIVLYTSSHICFDVITHVRLGTTELLPIGLQYTGCIFK